MSKINKPRAGSKAFSPRKRSKRQTPSIELFLSSDDTKVLGFACYKAGMSHALIKDLRKKAPTSNLDVSTPITILDAPPMTVFAIRAYIKSYSGLEVLTDVMAEKLDKDLSRSMSVPKQAKTSEQIKFIEKNLDEIVKFTVLVHTQPRKSGLKKKTPEILEFAVGGKDVKAQWEYCKSILGKDITIRDVFSESEFVDIIAVTKGKGMQGPVKRWGIKIQKRKHKRGGHMRHVGSIGPWTPSAVRWFVPMRGQMGYHQRTEFNKLIVKIGEKGEEINPDGGFVRYGLISGAYLVVKGSIPGPVKRLVGVRSAARGHSKKPAYSLEFISTASKLGV
ncbi:MAG: 50S ribosomal protein L3 [Candidatus Altiarchaeota archaeon]|nr:50S ribosomal protein L3 [Candidatus Altiarchaeota archaeon]